MEKQLFTWTGWDDQGDLCLSFYDCALIADIGELKKGEEFELIFVDFQNGNMELWRSRVQAQSTASYKLNLTVGEKLP